MQFLMQSCLVQTLHWHSVQRYGDDFCYGHDFRHVCEGHACMNKDVCFFVVVY